jgi:hypothetical protein
MKKNEKMLNENGFGSKDPFKKYLAVKQIK